MTEIEIHVKKEKLLREIKAIYADDKVDNEESVRLKEIAVEIGELDEKLRALKSKWAVH